MGQIVPFKKNKKPAISKKNKKILLKAINNLDYSPEFLNRKSGHGKLDRQIKKMMCRYFELKDIDLVYEILFWANKCYFAGGSSVHKYSSEEHPVENLYRRLSYISAWIFENGRVPPWAIKEYVSLKSKCEELFYSESE